MGIQYPTSANLTKFKTGSESKFYLEEEEQKLRTQIRSEFFGIAHSAQYLTYDGFNPYIGSWCIKTIMMIEILSNDSFWDFEICTVSLIEANHKNNRYSNCIKD